MQTYIYMRSVMIFHHTVLCFAYVGDHAHMLHRVQYLTVGEANLWCLT